MTRGQTIIAVAGLGEVLTANAVRLAKNLSSQDIAFVVRGARVSMPKGLVQDTLDWLQRLFPASERLDLTEVTQLLQDAAQTGNLVPCAEHPALQPLCSSGVDLWMSTPFSSIDKVLIELIRPNRLVIFDNGLYTHLDQPVFLYTETNLSSLGLLQKHLDLIAEVWLTLYDTLPHPGHYPMTLQRAIPAACIRESAHQFSLGAGPHPIPEALRAVTAFVIGSSLYRTQSISHPEEAQMYRQSIEDLRQQGHICLWREHPRAGRPLGRRFVSDPNVITLDSIFNSVPIEVFAEIARPELAVSFSSTAILVLEQCWNTKAFVIRPDLAEAMKQQQPHIYNLHRIVPVFAADRDSHTRSR